MVVQLKDVEELSWRDDDDFLKLPKRLQPFVAGYQILGCARDGGSKDKIIFLILRHTMNRQHWHDYGGSRAKQIKRFKHLILAKETSKVGL
jgi:hypothetical protein